MVFQPGQTGNPNGRPKGSRQKLTERFVDRLQADFYVHGVEAIKKARKQNPLGYLQIIASLMPKELKLDATFEIGSEPISELNRWLEALTTRAIEKNYQDTLQGGPILSPPLCIEQERRGEPVDIREDKRSTAKSEWLS